MGEMQAKWRQETSATYCKVCRVGFLLLLHHTRLTGCGWRSKSWLLGQEGGDWAAMQVVLFNIADMPLTGTFSFALRPYNSEGIAPIYSIAYDETEQTLVADGYAGPYTWPAPDGWALSGITGGDLFRANRGVMEDGGASRSTHLHDLKGFAHGVLTFRFAIEAWEEAEFWLLCLLGV